MTAALRAAAAAALLFASAPALAAAPEPGAPVAVQSYPEPERCPRLFAGVARIEVASAVTVAEGEVGMVAITYLGHSTFLIESPAGVRIATDYNDSVRPAEAPDIATMNRAHISHYSLRPQPGIRHLLRGWGEEGVPAAHELTYRDVWLRNVTTNIRGGFDEFNVQRDMNSMFVFEVAGLCIAHLGHLHHTLTDDHLDALGRVDVVMAPVDGSRTLSITSMIKVLRDIQASVVIPMHFFGQSTLSRFITTLSEHYDVKGMLGSTITLSRDTLPAVPTLFVPPVF